MSATTIPPSTPATGVKLGVMTSGGDAQGMNAALRAVVRSAIYWGATPYAVTEGWQGAVDGGDGIRELGWSDVSNVLQRGGTAIGTARCPEFRERSGMLKAAKHLVSVGIDRLVVIGGDGSLTGADEFRAAWPSLLAELVDAGDITADMADTHGTFHVAGLVGTIDNDLVGTDTTIGSDSALHRVVEALDALRSTAASHQRSFVVEVMGRHCGYLPLMAAIAGGCDAVIVPENPPPLDWPKLLSESLRRARAMDRRETLVVVAEGAQDVQGNAITSEDVAEALREHLGEDPRITILGHVQRGGTPSAYDRWMSTTLGVAAVREVLSDAAADDPMILGTRHNRIARLPLVETVARTRSVTQKMRDGDFDGALADRGRSFVQASPMFSALVTPPQEGEWGSSGKRIAVMHASGLAPGMNAAAWSAVRSGNHHGHRVFGVTGSFRGLARGAVEELTWGDTDGWISEGGARLGTSRHTPNEHEIAQIADTITEHRLDAVIVVGGIRAYYGVQAIRALKNEYPALQIPIVCVPATIDNNLPGTDVTIGTDTALNNLVNALDGIKQSASAHRRCFVVETMGRHCGYLATMSAVASGAERAYLPETGITLSDLHRDVDRMKETFADGKRLFLAVRNEFANERYTTDFIGRLFEEEGGDLFDVRTVQMGHVQQGGSPSPFDRLLAVRMVWKAVQHVTECFESGETYSRYVGLNEHGFQMHRLRELTSHLDVRFNRPKVQWWLAMRHLIDVLGDENHFNEDIPL